LYCSECGTRNPEENRFCGMCGAPLVRPNPADAERRPPQREAANVTMMPREQRPVPLSEVLAGKEAAEQRRAEREAERYIGEPARTVAPPPPPPPRRDVAPAHLGGPSFLGLNDPAPAAEPSPDYLLDDDDDYRPRRSYGRFMLLLLILAVFAGLGYLQWRKSEGRPLLPLELAAEQPPAASESPTASSESAAPATPADAATQVQAQAPPPVNPEQSNPQADQAASQPAASARENDGARADVDEQEAKPAKTAAQETVPQESAPKAEPAEPEKPSAAQAEQADAEIDSAAGERELELGRAYLSGRYGQRDAGEAAKWLWKAVSKGNTDASLALADLYLAGEGVEKNCEQARVLLTAAARKGNHDAASKLRTVSCD